ncbi:MAG: hypothetical protein IT492_14285 [Gammaproteobacteria bacterium]|nr:hypothetical protein [Gammaproteobacteria bacterium]
MTDNTPVSPPKRNVWVPFAVIGAFVAPILIAWWFAIAHPEAVPHQQLNHGELIHPPVDFAADSAGGALEALKLAPAEWGLVYFGAGPCELDCQRAVNLLTTIRGLIGAQGARVHVAALVDAAPAEPIKQALTIAAPQARASLAREAAARTGTARDQGIVILDSRRLAMMIFSVDAEPAGIKEDLKRLLRGSAIN